MCKGVNITSDSIIMEIKNAAYAYEGEENWVWNQLSCQFFKGKIHAIAGASGCGKSSVLYLLNGMIPHMLEGKMEGSVWFEGKNITEELPRYRCNKIGLVMQCPENQFCTFTVEEELAFGMENLCLPPEEMRGRIERVLDYIGMNGYEKRDLNQLSGGQKQKIAIASILVMEPEVLLLDEPTANLDPKSRQEIFSLIIRLAREQNKTIILIEHNLEAIIDEIDCLFLMNQKGELSGGKSGRDIYYGDGCPGMGTERTVEKCRRYGTECPPVLEISNLKFMYQKDRKQKPLKHQWILNGVDLSIKEGDFLAVVGENGAGKSTLLRLIFQISRQNEGLIKLYGKPVEKYKKKELYHQMGLVFQNPENQFVTNSVLDEMMFSLRKERISRQEKEDKVFKMLRQFQLERDKDKSPFVLSQGQKRRLSVATMLLTEQKILFLDEPTYGQDFENRHKLMKDMQALNENGTTIVMITHDLSLVKNYANRVIEIQEGKVSFDSTSPKYFDKLLDEGREYNVCVY